MATVTTVAVFGLLTFIAYKVDYRFKSKTIYTNCQPSSVSYGSFDPYCLKVKKTYFVTGVRYEIAVNAKNNESYGYLISYPGQNNVSGLTASHNIVIWTMDGVELKTPQGQSIFIEKALFIGGR